MILKFSLYGFLKNLQFFEPFLILHFLNLGLNYFQIGLLIAFRTVCINIFEVPSGALADLYGRKSSMIFSLSCYIVSFLVFSFVSSYRSLFFAMFFFSIGEAFRTGTHKAMIFDWLRLNGRLDEKTKIYGYTRSWSKIGSSLSVLISSATVIILNDYRWVFILSIIPYLGGILNLMGYPDYMNRSNSKGHRDVRRIFSHLFENLKISFKNRNVRMLIIQSAGFDGSFKVIKDYLQPVLKSQALFISALFTLPVIRSTGILAGVVYSVIYILSAAAARKSHLFLDLIKGLIIKNSRKSHKEPHITHESLALFLLMMISAVIVFISGVSVRYKIYSVSIIAFVIYFLIQNIWRPIIVSQYDNYTNSENQATILSIESQAKNSSVFFLAPIAGFFADNFGLAAGFIFISLMLMAVSLYIYKFNKSESI